MDIAPAMLVYVGVQEVFCYSVIAGVVHLYSIADNATIWYVFFLAVSQVYSHGYGCILMEEAKVLCIYCLECYILWTKSDYFLQSCSKQEPCTVQAAEHYST